MSLKALANKIASMTNMEKITSSMKMVAAAKMKGTEMRLNAGKAFGGRVVAAAFPQPDVDEETLEEDVAAQLVTDSDTNAFLIISSDRGLCGGVNSAVVKCTKAASGSTEVSRRLKKGDFFGARRPRGVLARLSLVGATMASRRSCGHEEAGSA